MDCDPPQKFWITVDDRHEIVGIGAPSSLYLYPHVARFPKDYLAEFQELALQPMVRLAKGDYKVSILPDETVSIVNLETQNAENLLDADDVFAPFYRLAVRVEQARVKNTNRFTFIGIAFIFYAVVSLSSWGFSEV